LRKRFEDRLPQLIAAGPISPTEAVTAVTTSSLKCL
jgi:hypothetical protein